MNVVCDFENFERCNVFLVIISSSIVFSMNWQHSADRKHLLYKTFLSLQSNKNISQIMYRMVIVEGRCDQLTSSSLHTLVWFGQILLLLYFYHPIYMILGQIRRFTLVLEHFLRQASKWSCGGGEHQYYCRLKKHFFQIKTLLFFFRFIFLLDCS